MSDQITQTFHHFSDLPLELQSIIFEYAFAAEDPQSSRRELEHFSWTADRPCFSFAHPCCPSIRMGFWWFSEKRMAGRGVMAVSRLFRMLGLESWRRMMRKASTSADKALSASESKKKRLLRIMDALILEVKKRLES